MAAIAMKSFVFLVLFGTIFCDDSSFYTPAKETNKKYSKKDQKKELYRPKTHKHKDTEEFAKKLEYDANLKEGDNALDFGLSPIDLNLLLDEEFAQDVIEGVEDEFAAIDQEFGESGDAGMENETTTPKRGAISLMHQGMYIPSTKYNSLIDGLVSNVKKDLVRREMDPLYFNIHNRGIVRHTPRRNKPKRDSAGSARPKPEEDKRNNKTSNPLGVGIIHGLKKLKRFGNAESREDGPVTLVRSHYFFGPLNIGLIFGSADGIRLINTTLPSLAAHALIEVASVDNSTSLKEFIIDSPMEYEIRLRGAKNRRYRSLSHTSISRLFKRGGRMEKRLCRSFRRGLRKPIREFGAKGARSNSDNKGKDKKTKSEPRKP